MEEEKSEPSLKEQKIRKIVQWYYSRKDIQKAIFEFSKNREVVPRYFEFFGKRPDSLQYLSDIFELVKKGTTSFHCSEEIWKNPLNLSTEMNEKQLGELREGWDLLIDIDCKWFDYSKLAAKSIIQVLKNNQIKNFGLKFSGSKGFHIIIPWKSFPKEISGISTKNLFPDIPRKIVSFIRFESEKQLKKMLPEDFYEQFKGVKIKKGIKCNKCNEIAKEYYLTKFFCSECKIGEEKKIDLENKQVFKCSNCGKEFDVQEKQLFYECSKCNINSKQNLNNFSRTFEVDLFELMGLDIVLVSPRHLFRMPYSLHEKTALASIVLEPEQIEKFNHKDADPLLISKIKNFLPDSEDGEAKILLTNALDWAKQNQIERGEKPEKITGKYSDYKPMNLKNISDEQFPPCVINILKGIPDGKKRALVFLINLFKNIGLEKEDIEKRIFEWNKKNEPPLKEGYIVSQLRWAYQRKPRMPQNCKEYYQGIGVCQPDVFCLGIKNPLTYVSKKNFSANKGKFKKD